MMLDVSRSVYMRIDVSGSSGGSSVLGIYGNLTRTLSENDSGGGLFLAAQTAFFSLSIVGADGGPTLSTPAMSSVIAIGRGATVLRNRSTIPIVSFLMCTDLSTFATSSLCTAPGFTATLSGTNTAMISVNDINTNLTGQSSPIRASSITSDILQVGDGANTILPVILMILPCPLDRNQTPQNASWWSINFAAGASAVRIGHGAHVSGLPANPDIEPKSLAVGVFTAAAVASSSSARPSYANVVLNYSSLSPNSSSASSAALIHVSGDATVVGRVRVASTDPNQTFTVYTSSLASSSPVTTTWLIYMDQCSALISLVSADVSTSVPLFQSASQNTSPWLQQNAPVDDVERAVQERRSIISLQVTMYGGDDNVAPATSTFGTVNLNHVDFATASGVTTQTSFTSLVVHVIENATRLENASLSSTPPLVWWPQLLQTLAPSNSMNDTHSFVLPTNSSARAVTADFHTACITIDAQEVHLFESTSLLLDNTTRPKLPSGVVGYVPLPIPQSPEDARGVQLNWAQLECSSTTSASLSEGTHTATTFTKSLPSMSASEMSLTDQSMTHSTTLSFTSTFTNATPSHTPATLVPSHSLSATDIPTVTISVSPTQPTQVRLSSSRSWNATASGQPTLSHELTASPIQTQSTIVMPSDSDTASRSTTPSHTRSRRYDSASLVLPATMTLESSLSTTHPSLPITWSSSQVMPLTDTNQSTPTMTIIVRKNSRPEIPAAVGDVVGGTAVVTALLSPAGALGARRLSLMMGLGSCSSLDDLPDIDSVLTDPLDVTASPTGLLLGPDYGATHRGAVIGNIIICVAAVFVGFLLTLVVRAADRKEKKDSRVSTSPEKGNDIHAASSFDKQEGDHHHNTIIESAAALRLPGLFFIVVALFYQQVIVSSMLLLVYPSGAWESSDRSIGACGLAVSFIIIASMSRVLDPRKEYFRAVPVAVDESELHELHQHLFPAPWRNTRRHSSQSFVTRAVNKIVYFFAWLQAEKVMWTSRVGGGDALFVERYGFLFEGCDGGRQWWVIGEMLGTIALSGLSAFVPESIPECLAALWSSVAVSVVQLLMTLVLRPMNSRFENTIVIGLAAIQVAVGLCQALAAPDMVSFVLSALAATLSALLVLATLAHIVRSRLRGISRLLKSQRRQFLPRKQQKRGGPSGLQKSLVQQQHELLGLPSSASLGDFKGLQHSRALDDVVLPPIEQLDLLSIVDIICVATKERNKRFSRNHFFSDVHDAGKASGFVDDPTDSTRPSRLSVKFLMGHRPKRRIQIPDLPDEFVVELSELHGHPEPLHDTTSNNGGDMESHLALSFQSV
ncbi:transmembrane protein, putative [Bodo saltans]|uniref:Transmembrane protein, putative n=1 Tax=Bodo saltans TaxID=75058 RepID=A0A0S4JPU9_BODSA|nr:transmembrane protein, putative [Bodo saltans]|eukprot:CUG93574.1 transmembrane protein, putative [Bodo saltans]